MARCEKLSHGTPERTTALIFSGSITHMLFATSEQYSTSTQIVMKFWATNVIGFHVCRKLVQQRLSKQVLPADSSSPCHRPSQANPISAIPRKNLPRHRRSTRRSKILRRGPDQIYKWVSREWRSYSLHVALDRSGTSSRSFGDRADRKTIERIFCSLRNEPSRTMHCIECPVSCKAFDARTLQPGVLPISPV